MKSSRLLPALALSGLLVSMTAEAAAPLQEPGLRVQGTAHQQPHIALTLDACSGRTDARIFSALVSNRIPATVFVTARWLKRNPDTVRLMLDHPELFQIENHGAKHIPAVDVPGKVYGIATAGSPEAVTAEVVAGAEAVKAATGHAPQWYRGATGRYNSGALHEIAATGEAVAGYSLRADDGATIPAAAVEKRLSTAKSGDVVIAHANHPEKSAGAGLVKGVLALKARGFLFVKLGPPPRSALPAHAS